MDKVNSQLFSNPNPIHIPMNNTTTTIPPAAIFAHGYLAAYDASGPDNSLWINHDLLAIAPGLSVRADYFFDILRQVYCIDTDLLHTISMPTAGPLHLTIRGVAELIAYTPAHQTPPDIAKIVVASLVTPVNTISQHIGAHRLRLHAYSHYLFAQSTFDTNTGPEESGLTAQAFVRDEIRGIAAAFTMAAEVTGLPVAEVVNKEDLLSRRARISFIV